ncbi:FAD-dependent oxidoreductase [Paraburkholderia sp. J8-2]|uniref:NAD(P)/FAD-dependent oxidoreductase n=1 Tax=Paraburkholderia sp. J8-2 TaxID=2805440 RepID=UPI002AB67E83|nr:FAD-dependent oxidoreductase [Paraburkholderia sp. J8-2]
MQLDKFLLAKAQGPLSEYLSAMTEPEPETVPLASDVDTDVAVVGAGYTGLSAAIELAKKGLSVRVLEARSIGWGASGRAWGQVAAFSKFMPAKVERDLGEAIAAKVNAACAAGPDLVFSFIERYQMQCSAYHTGNLVSAHTPAKGAELEAIARDLERRKLPVQLLDKAATKAYIGSERYSVALFDPRGASLNPLGYARGLGRAAIMEGAQIHCQTPVRALVKTADGWRLRTHAGSVKASRVILATNAFNSDELFPGLGRAVFPVRAYQMISEPLSKEALEIVLPGKQPLNDTRKLFSGVRLWPDGRLQVGVDGPPFAMDGEAMLNAARRRITMMFPMLKDLRWEYSWGGWVDMTLDEYPRAYPLADGLWTGFGFSGRGIAMGTMLGRDLATLAVGGSERDTVLPISTLKPIWFHRIHRPLINSLVWKYRFEDYLSDLRYGKIGA